MNKEREREMYICIYGAALTSPPNDLRFRVLGFRVLGFRVLGFRVLGFRV